MFWTIELIENLLYYSVYLVAFGTAIVYTRMAVNQNGHYSNASWNYIFKKWWIKRKVQNIAVNRSPVSFDYEGPSPNVKEVSIAQEEHLFFGCDSDGNLLLVNQITGNSEVENYLMLKLADGRIFALPEYPLTTFHKIEREQNYLDCLLVECLTPYVKWRITFNGLLKNIKSIDGEKLEHVIFTFFWTAATNPLDLPFSLSPALLASSLAKEPESSDNLVNELSYRLTGHDQFGSLFGQLTLAGQVTELNLPGVRQRRWMNLTKSELHRLVTFVGVCKDGNVFVLGAISFKQRLTHIQFGFLRKANGQFWPVESTDFHLSGFGEAGVSIPKAGTILFKANGEDYLVLLHFSNTAPIHMIEGNPLNWKSIFTTAAISLDRSTGQGICITGYPLKENEQRSLPMPKTQRDITQITDSHKLSVSFSEPECQNENVCGGKGASLGCLGDLMSTRPDSDLKFIVPKGFVLTTNAFKLQVQRHNELQKSIENISSNIATDHFENICKRTVNLFLNTPIEPEIVQSICSIIDVLREDYKSQSNNNENLFRVAVRSSALGEDGAATSAAGQNETTLGCATIDEIMQAVQSCWGSLYSYQSVVYRQQNLQPIFTEMAVVIQTMVPSECAGVLFTRHPVTSDPYKILISANYGLGESVVSGKVDPDSYTVARSYENNELEILKKEKGEKSHAIQMRGTVKEEETTSIERDSFCLSDDQILALSKIGLLLEEVYGGARDIEWAVFENEIYLLQSRPMTSLHAFTSWELLHEFDTAIMSPQDVSTFGNIGEILPEVVTPLTLSTFVRTLEKGMMKNVMLREANPFFSTLILSSHYRMAFDVCNMFLLAVEKKIEMGNKMHGIIVFGHDFISDDIHQIALQRNGAATLRKTIPMLWALIKDLIKNKSRSKDLQNFTDKFIGTYDPFNLDKFQTAQELFSDLTVKVDQMAYPSIIHGSTTKSSFFFQIIALTILVENSSALTVDHSSDFALMLSLCNDVESAEIPQQIANITKKIRSAGKDEAFSQIDPKFGLEWLRENCNDAHELLTDFLKKHFHRTYKEFELESVTWGMQPAIVIEMLQASSRHNQGDAADTNSVRVTKTTAEIVAELKSPKKSLTRTSIKWILPFCKSSVQLREKSKSNFIACTHEIRKGFRHLAQLMHREGLLPNENLIFYLTQNELKNHLIQPNSNFIAKACRRKRLFTEWRKYRFGEMHFGLIRPEQDEEIVVSGTHAIEVIGTPVCQGIISGRACVLKSFDEVGKIRSGDILVTHGTDIGWSPYFPMLGGVITELGGLISHGAVVAREYGLPCIVGASNATSKIQFGDHIRMDANTGVIVKLN